MNPHSLHTTTSRPSPLGPASRLALVVVVAALGAGCYAGGGPAGVSEPLPRPTSATGTEVVTPAPSVPAGTVPEADTPAGAATTVPAPAPGVPAATPPHPPPALQQTPLTDSDLARVDADLAELDAQLSEADHDLATNEGDL